MLQWMSKSIYLGLMMVGLFLSSCDVNRKVHEAPLLASEEKATLEQFQPKEVLGQITEWYPHDWRTHLIVGLLDSNHTGRLQSLLVADSLRPDEEVVNYQIAVAYLEDDSLPDTKLARPILEKLFLKNPENGVLAVMLAYVLVKDGDVNKARALFLNTKEWPGGTFYYPRMEQILLGLFSRTRHLNPYTLMEAEEIYRRIPFPPFEKWIDILYSVFLSPLPDHPYDIRIRGRDAARSLFLFGERLRVESYAGPKIFSNGYEQQVLGFMFQLKAAEFQTFFYETFPDSLGAQQAANDFSKVQSEFAQYQSTNPWSDSTSENYRKSWSQILKVRPKMFLYQAIDSARSWPLWKKSQNFYYPKKDD